MGTGKFKEKKKLQKNESKPLAMKRHCLLIEGLNLNATREDVWAHFSEVSSIAKITLPNRSGNCIIQLKGKKYFLKAQRLSGTLINGEPISVTIASVSRAKKIPLFVPCQSSVSKLDVKEPSAKKSFNLFLGNLPPTTQQKHILEHFNDVSNIVSIKVCKGQRSTMHGYLEVLDEQSCQKALKKKGTKMLGREISVLKNRQRKTEESETNVQQSVEENEIEEARDSESTESGQKKKRKKKK